MSNGTKTKIYFCLNFYLVATPLVEGPGPTENARRNERNRTKMLEFFFVN
jgi:hypothetical protein